MIFIRRQDGGARPVGQAIGLIHADGLQRAAAHQAGQGVLECVVSSEVEQVVHWFFLQESPGLLLDVGAPLLAHKCGEGIMICQQFIQGPIGVGRGLSQMIQQAVGQHGGHRIGPLVVLVQPGDEHSRLLQHIKIGGEDVAQQEPDCAPPTEAARGRRRLVQPPPLGRCECAHDRVGQVGEEGVQGQRDVTALLPQVVGKSVQRAGGDDDQGVVGAPGTSLLHPLAQRDRVGFAYQREAALGQRGQHVLIGQQPVGVADQSEDVGVGWEMIENSGKHRVHLSSVKRQTSGVKRQASNVRRQTSGVILRASCVSVRG